MAKKLLLGKNLLDFLKKHPDEKFTTDDLAKWILETYPETCDEKKKRSEDRFETDEDFLNQLRAEVSSRISRLRTKEHQGIKSTEDSPRKHYYSERSDEQEIKQAESADKANTTAKPGSGGEHALYSLLGEYLWGELKIYPKRIDEKRSSNKPRTKGNNHWLFPDMVGMDDLGSKWKSEVRECAEQHSDKRTRLWSFEVKPLLNRANARVCFFQAVSNSSWANFGYLVAREIDGTAMKELQMLSTLHGIGLIHLNAPNPLESKILIPAREKPRVDWDSVNRLAIANKDFMKYVDLIKQFYQTKGEAQLKGWDIPENLSDDF